MRLAWSPAIALLWLYSPNLKGQRGKREGGEIFLTLMGALNGYAIMYASMPISHTSLHCEKVRNHAALSVVLKFPIAFNQSLMSFYLMLIFVSFVFGN